VKTYFERTQSVLKKLAIKKRQRRIVAACVSSCVILALVLVLFLPFSTTPPSVLAYRSSPYYGLIQRLNEATYQKPAYKNRFETILHSFDRLAAEKLDGAPMAPGAPVGDPEENLPGNTPDNGENAYQEVTDNQVEGVIEADLFKSSDKYLYYLRGNVLSVYSLEGEDSRLVGEFTPDFTGSFGVDEMSVPLYYGAEMYLSKDGSTVTLVAQGSRKDLGSFTVLVSLDVTDPANIQQTGFVLFQGSYLTSRLVEGGLLLVCNYQFYRDDIDFSEPATFVPSYVAEGEKHLFPAENIVCPENLTDTRYTVICKLSEKDLQVRDTAALLSFSQEVYVSGTAIYATQAFGESRKEEDKIFNTAMTRIVGFGYTGDTLVEKGTVTVRGQVKDQYSMDEYDGFLRIVTTTRDTQSRVRSNGSVGSSWIEDIRTNCDLYCVDLKDWSVRSCVQDFAPWGEEVTSARFDGTKAYVCTALVVQLTDPVFFFDLTDVDHITWTDTGTIGGFSSSMINFGEGISLGVGVNENRELKLEVYRQNGGFVESVAAFEYCGSYSEEYKSYNIHRENSMIGLAVQDWNDGNFYYLLLHFDGYQFRLLQKLPAAIGYLPAVRSVIVNGWLYLLTDMDFQAKQIW